MKLVIRWRGIFFGLAIGGVLALGLAWASNYGQSLRDWQAFLLVGLLGAGVLLLTWWVTRREQPPRWLLWLVLGAVLLRLGMAVVWYLALPEYGYGGEPELAGYVMSDAHRRDLAAWELATSELPLHAAFQEYQAVDQYGGLLWLSALIYRYSGAAVHQPLLIVMVTALCSALAVAFVWLFARRAWDAQVAGLAAWGLALYPEAVLLGSSQMREALIVPLVIAAFYALLVYEQTRRWPVLLAVIALLLLSVPLSTMFAVLLLGGLLIFALTLEQARLLRNWRFWAALAGMGLLIWIGLVVLGERILPGSGGNPLQLLQNWLQLSSWWDAYTSQRASGWLQKIFRSMPEWTHRWFLLGYGVVRPFLPAALLDDGIPLWKAITIWRSLGWTLLLPFLVYVPLQAMKKDIQGRGLVLGSSLIVWFGILLASYRGGGDDWDNPRYRLVFVGLQLALVAWVWQQQRRRPDPWLKRILIAGGLVMLWFIPWYLTRYMHFNWPVQEFFSTLGLGLATALLYLVWDWLRSRRRA